MKKGDLLSLISAIAVISGTAMGAGYLSIPYSISKTGFLLGLFYLIVLGGVTLLFKLILGEIVLRTNGSHQLAGYAEKYLGKKGKFLMFFGLLFGTYSALVAYLIAEGQSLSYLFFGSFSYAIYFSIFFWIIMAIFTYYGFGPLKKYTKFVLFFVFILLIIAFFSILNKFSFENLSYSTFSIGDLFLPFGVILFSFIGFSSIPEARWVLYKKEYLFKKAIIFGILVPLIFYCFFSFIMLGAFGLKIGEIATFGLHRFFSLIAILTMFTSYFVQSICIRDLFRFDFKLGRIKGWILALFAPLLIFLTVFYFNLVTFVDILSIAGVVSSGITVFLIVLIVKQARKKGSRKPEYHFFINPIILFFILSLFLLGILSAVFHYFS